MARVAQSDLAVRHGVPVLQVTLDGVRLVIPPPGPLCAMALLTTFVLFLVAAVYLVYLFCFSPLDLPADRPMLAPAWILRLNDHVQEIVIATLSGTACLMAFLRLASIHWRTEVWTITHRGIRQLRHTPFGRATHYWPREEILNISVQRSRRWILGSAQAAIAVDLADGRQVRVFAGADVDDPARLSDVFRAAMAPPPAILN